MLDVAVGKVNTFYADFFQLHLAFAARRAERLLALLLIFLALAFPPFAPPSFPKATAWGFLGGSSGSVVCPVARRTISRALWAGSRGSFFGRIATEAD